MMCDMETEESLKLQKLCRENKITIAKDYKSKKVQVFSLPELNMIGILPNNYNYNDVLTFINLKKSQKYESNIK